MLILSWLCKRGVLKTDTPLLRNRLYFNILQFTLKIGSGAGTTAAAAAGFACGERWVTKEERKATGRGVTKEVRSGEIGFFGPVRKNNFTAQQGRRSRVAAKTRPAAAGSPEGGGNDGEARSDKGGANREIGFCTRSDFIRGTLCINRP